MPFELTALPYDRDALEPHISAETIDYHYGKHHQTYVDNLNRLIAGTEYADSTLEEIIRASSGPIFQNAAQIWNHTFYWSCLTPDSGGVPIGPLAVGLRKAFGNLDEFKAQFIKTALGTFGSGWVWLVKQPDGGLAIESTLNADCPLTRGQKPLLVCDVWEHAYYIDYHNRRADYLEAYWQLIDWDYIMHSLMS